MLKTLKSLGADVRCSACNLYSTQDDVAAALVSDGISVFGWKGMTLADHWSCAAQALTWEAADAKGDGPDIVLDDGGDLTMLIDMGYKAEQAFKQA